MTGQRCLTATMNCVTGSPYLVLTELGTCSRGLAETTHTVDRDRATDKSKTPPENMDCGVWSSSLLLVGEAKSGEPHIPTPEPAPQDVVVECGERTPTTLHSQDCLSTLSTHQLFGCVSEIMLTAGPAWLCPVVAKDVMRKTCSAGPVS
jgi:hypothetical protein